MKATRYFSLIQGPGIAAALAVAGCLCALPQARAGEPVGKGLVETITVEDIYEGGRGLITTTGPTGLFINPTSGTMPQGAATLQYCFFLPNGATFNRSGHGWIASYGVTDFFELGVISLYTTADNQFSIGPQARLRFLKDQPDSWVPEFSLVGYSRFGDDFSALWGLAPTVFKRFPIGDESGWMKSVGLHGGARYENNDGTAQENLWNGYGGAEVQFPMRIYLVGEVSSKESGRGETKVPYSFGFQWRAGMVNMSIAGIQNGSLPGPRLYFGVGFQAEF